MKLISIFLFLLGFTLNSSAQYYFNDIIGTEETNRQMQSYLANKVQTISATGTDQNAVKTTDFSEFYEIRENGRLLKTTSIVNFSKKVTFTHFNEKGKLAVVIDSTNGTESKTVYQYDINDRLIIVQNMVKDSANEFSQTESHYWIYRQNGQLEKMWRIVNSSLNKNIPDSLEVRFVTDEQGNLAEERSFKHGRETGFLYYYYNDNNNLTDIVRYNSKAKKLLPDILLEYDEQGKLIQKITTTSSLNMSYLIWRYIYNPQGLKTKEALFNKEKVLTGKIEYMYSFFK